MAGRRAGWLLERRWRSILLTWARAVPMWPVRSAVVKAPPPRAAVVLPRAVVVVVLRRRARSVLDERAFLDSVEQLVCADRGWLPSHGGEGSLYLRPFMFATTPSLAVGPPAHTTFAVIASPAGPYFASGVTGIRFWVSTDYTRAAVGGTGAAKCGGNYAAGLAAQVQAQQHGCDQVLYVDGAEHRWLEESGTMNLVLVTRDGELVTRVWAPSWSASPGTASWSSPPSTACRRSSGGWAWMSCAVVAGTGRTPKFLRPGQRRLSPR